MRFKSFLKEHFDNIGRAFIYQIGMTIFGLSVTKAVSVAASNHVVVLCVSLFAILFHMFLLYTMVRELGAKDKIRVDAGRMTKDEALGAKIVSVANIPNLVLGALMLLGVMFGYFIAHAEWAKQTYVIAYIIAGLIEATYTGALSYLYSLLGELAPETQYLIAAIFYVFSSLPAIVVSYVGYHRGLNDDRVAQNKNVKS